MWSGRVSARRAGVEEKGAGVEKLVCGLNQWDGGVLFSGTWGPDFFLLYIQIKKIDFQLFDKSRDNYDREVYRLNIFDIVSDFTSFPICIYK